MATPTDKDKEIKALVTRLCAAKVCQNMSKYSVIETEMKKKSKAMGYGENLSVIPPFAYSHFLYEVMKIYEKHSDKHEEIRGLYEKAVAVSATAEQRTAFNTRRGEINELERVLGVIDSAKIPSAKL